ncbi:Perforin-1 [Labeo rohita]|uniref:Perforin-1 n=1 Tax=Labeo rohita TaxID=84645 RepID=A0ABQ8LPM6_LABRO|nr:Perforin-1 [Labeo rohita]
MKVCSEPCKIGRKCNARDRCGCVCETCQMIKSNCCPAEKGLATLKVYNLRAKVKCEPSLQGPQCNEVKPSPVAAPLADIFSSRNGVLVKDMPRLELAFNNSDKFTIKSLRQSPQQSLQTLSLQLS